MSEAKVIIQLSDLHIPSSGNLYGTVDSLDNVAQILGVLESGGEKAGPAPADWGFSLTAVRPAPTAACVRW